MTGAQKHQGIVIVLFGRFKIESTLTLSKLFGSALFVFPVAATSSELDDRLI